MCLPGISLSGMLMFGLEAQCDFNSLIPFGLFDSSDGDERPGDSILLCPTGNPLHEVFNYEGGGRGLPYLCLAGGCSVSSDLT